MENSLRWPLVGIFLILAVQALYWSAGFLLPITAAVLGYLTLSPLRRRLSRFGVPSSITAAILTFGIAAIALAGLMRFAEPVSNLLDNLPELIEQFSDGVASGGGTLEKLNEAAKAAEDAVKTESDDVTLEVKVVEDADYITRLFQSAPQIIGQSIFALTLMFFLISSGDLFILKIVQAASNFDEKRKAVSLVQKLEAKLGRYLGSIALINLLLGAAIAIAMWLWGLPNPILLGLIAFLLNFIPFLGAVAGATFAGLVAFGEFRDLWPTFAVFATYMALTSLEGQFFTPHMLSNRLKLNTPFVFISVAFFAWIWSVIGMVVAVPILIVAKIILDEFESTQKLGTFLGGADKESATAASSGIGDQTIVNETPVVPTREV